MDDVNALVKKSPQQLAAEAAYSMKQPSRPGRAPFSLPFGPGRLKPQQTHELPQVSDRVWDATLSRNAVNQTSRGILQDAADLAQKMKQDSAYAAALSRRISGLIRSPIRIVPANDSDEARQVAACCARKLRHMLPEIELSRFVEWWHQLDTSFGTLDWHYDPMHGLMCPCLRSLNPRFSWYDVGRSTWVYASWEGNWDVVEGDGRWVLGSQWRYGDFAGACSKLAADWIAKQYATRDWAEWSDYAAFDILLAKVGAGGNDTDKAKQDFAEQVANARTTRVITLYQSSEPGSSYDVEKLGLSDGEGWEQMRERVNMVDRKYLVYFLGGNLSEVLDQGARAAAQVHSAAERELIKGDAAKLAPVLRDQVLLPFVVENWCDERLVPDLHFDVALADELEHRAQGYMNFSQFLAKMPKGYVIDNVREIAQDFGIRIRQVSAELGPPADKISVKETGTDADPGVTDPAAKPTVAPEKKDRAGVAVHPAPARRTIRKVFVGGKPRWRVVSKTGKNLGTFDSIEEARKRLKEVEAFKHMDKDQPHT